MTITELADSAAPFQRFARATWDRPFKFYHFFTANDFMRSSDGADLPLSRFDLLADDWLLIEVSDLDSEVPR